MYFKKKDLKRHKFVLLPLVGADLPGGGGHEQNLQVS